MVRLRPESYNAVCPRPDSCNTLVGEGGALMSVTPNLCCDETKLRSIHSPDTSISRTLCDPMDCSPPGSSVHGISHVRKLEWLPFLLQGIFPASNTPLLNYR